jgi:type I restriction enzyme M protein
VPSPEQQQLLSKLLGPLPDSSRTTGSKTKKKQPTKKNCASSALLGFEEKMWAAADKLRGSMDSAEYKHVVLGLIFLKYISDAFEERHAALEKEKHADPEDRDEYEAENVFWVPPKARWPELQAKAKDPRIGVLIDKAMEAIEAQNPTLKGTLPKEYARPQLDKHRLGELIDDLSRLTLLEDGKNSKDVLGRVYEYFLNKFASQEGKGGGEFYTPSSVVRVLVEMLEPFQGRVYDPCCGSGGMFVQSEKFVEAHGGTVGDIAVYGQEWNATTWRLCKMNLAIRGIEANLGAQWADTFRSDAHKGLKADFVMANPPFNISDWGGDKLKDDARWQYGTPPVGNANYAWLQHIISHLAPSGVAGVVLANGSMSSQQSGEGEIRKRLVEADLVDCMVALPGQLFYSTQIPACLWFLARNKKNKGFRDRRGEVLFIDARKMGTLADRVHRDLSDEEIAKIAKTYHAWRGEKDAGKYADVPGFCKSAKQSEVEQHQFVRGRRGSGGRWRAVRGEDEATGRDVGRAVQGGGAVGKGDSEESEGVGVWGVRRRRRRTCHGLWQRLAGRSVARDPTAKRCSRWRRQSRSCRGATAARSKS